jgi:hypothetical protein
MHPTSPFVQQTLIRTRSRTMNWVPETKKTLWRPRQVAAAERSYRFAMRLRVILIPADMYVQTLRGMIFCPSLGQESTWRWFPINKTQTWSFTAQAHGQLRRHRHEARNAALPIRTKKLPWGGQLGVSVRYSPGIGPRRGLMDAGMVHTEGQSLPVS